MREQFYYGHGKLLLTGEYFILDGAHSVALPTNLGQTLSVKYERSNTPKLFWKSYDSTGKCWFEAEYDLWRFNCIDNESEEALVLQKILREARNQNIHFLRDEVDVKVETRLEFPLGWGLGSSSTLIYNIAQWAYVSPFDLLKKTFGGSGYDIACAQSVGPITYEIKSSGPRWEACEFNPHFRNNIYFVYLNRKQNTRESIERYRELVKDKEYIDKMCDKISRISQTMMESIDFKEFEQLVFEHENIVSSALDLPRIKESHFSDYWGAVKSLGAWGGDFVLVTSDKTHEETKEYFKTRGFSQILSFDELILQRPLKDNLDKSFEKVSHESAGLLN